MTIDDRTVRLPLDDSNGVLEMLRTNGLTEATDTDPKPGTGNFNLPEGWYWAYGHDIKPNPDMYTTGEVYSPAHYVMVDGNGSPRARVTQGPEGLKLDTRRYTLRTAEEMGTYHVQLVDVREVIRTSGLLWTSDVPAAIEAMKAYAVDTLGPDWEQITFDGSVDESDPTVEIKPATSQN
jgi:hypothetical protein